MSEAQDSIHRLTRMLNEMADCGMGLSERINHIWLALIVIMVVGSFVIGGLAVHAVGDYFRFEGVNEQLADLKKSVSQCTVKEVAP